MSATTRPVDPDAARAADLADYFRCSARLRIGERFRAAGKNADRAGCAFARKIEGRLPAILSEGILRAAHPSARIAFR